MERKNQLGFIFVGLLLGALLASALWLCAGLHLMGDKSQEAAASTAAQYVSDSTPQEQIQETAGSLPQELIQEAAGSTSQELIQETAGNSPQEQIPETAHILRESQPLAVAGGTVQAETHETAANQGQTISVSSANTWDPGTVYYGGDMVSYNGCQYRAKWWTQGEKPDSSDVWENLRITDGQAVQPEGAANVPIDAGAPQNTQLTDFKVVGYYPSWKPDKLQFVDFGVLTHVCYAFAIPTADGGLRDLDNPDTARQLISSAHANGAKVLLSVGGWSYNDTPLEGVFMEATATEEKTARFADSILAMCRQYGFDGVDMDWEHPRTDGTSAMQYESLMTRLADQLHGEGKLLTAAVLSGATADGNIYYDAAAHTNTVLNAVDFINVMAYDGGDGPRHSSYDFSVNCGAYWTKTRGLPPYKVVLGVPFYARPSWADYGTILESVPDAWSTDHVSYNGMDVYYNGTDTIAQKTRYAREHLGGIMIWELTQDTADQNRSLLQAVRKTIE